MLHWCCKSPAYFVSLSTYPWHRAVAFQNYYWYLPWPFHDNIICIELQNSEAITLLSIQPSFTSFGYAKKIFQLISVVSIDTQVFVSRLKLSLHWYCEMCPLEETKGNCPCPSLCTGGQAVWCTGQQVAGRPMKCQPWEGTNQEVPREMAKKCFRYTKHDHKNQCWIY